MMNQSIIINATQHFVKVKSEKMRNIKAFNPLELRNALKGNYHAI